MKINEDYLANILFRQFQMIGVDRNLESLSIKEIRKLAHDICYEIEKEDEPPF